MNQESMTMAARRLAITVLPAPTKRFLLSGRDHAVDAIARTRVKLGHLGPLPSFIIIGAGKSGTTYLYDRLTEHPLSIERSSRSRISSDITSERAFLGIVRTFSLRLGTGSEPRSRGRRVAACSMHMRLGG